jgi:hypothetical protein
MSAHCTCGAEMDPGPVRTVSGDDELEKWFEGQFKSHFLMVHSKQARERS